MKLEVLRHFETGDQLAAQAASDLANMIVSRLATQSVHLVLTGGTVGINTLAKLAPLLRDADLSNLDLWWGDERFVDAESKDRNFMQASEVFLSKVSIPSSNLHQMPSDRGQFLADAAAEFSTQIHHAAPRFDVVLLGMGSDGHVASLFPGSEAISFGDYVVAESHSPKPPPERISMSYSALCSAQEVWFLVAGSDKAEAVSRVFAGADIPASKVSGRQLTRWYLDTQAAVGITS